MKRDSMLPFEDETAVNEPELPLPEGKTSFKPEELYRFTRIKPFVLRFWESEFPSLIPKEKGAEGLEYIRADVEMILAIKHLLYDEGLTLAEARQRLSGADVATTKKVGTATRKPTQKKAVPKQVSKKKPSVKKGGAATAAAPKLPDMSHGKRGLPGDEASRSRVSLEELLPGSGAAGGAAGGPGRSKSKKTPAGTRAPAGALPHSPAKTDTEALDLRRKLSAALLELRELLTFIHKGDK